MRVLEQHVQRGEGKMGEFLRREKAGQEGGKSVVQIKANVQSHAQGFYAKCGYLVEGHEFLEVSSSRFSSRGEEEEEEEQEQLFSARGAEG